MGAGRFSNIDGLRAIAAISVLFHHILGDFLREASNQNTTLIGSLNSIISSFDFGRFGVVLFFLISGVVVPFSIKSDQLQPIRRFAIGRFFRLYPAFWLSLIFMYGYLVFTGGAPELKTLLANATMAANAFGQPWLSGVYWTLFIELIFYILIAVAFMAGILRQPMLILAAGLLLALSTGGPFLLRSLGINLPVVYIGLHLSFLFCGLLLRLTVIEKERGTLSAALVLIIVQMGIIVSIGDFSLARNDTFFIVGKLPVIASYLAAYSVFLLSLWTMRPQSKLLSSTGEISYSIYLFHVPVCWTIYLFLPPTGAISDLITMALCVIASFVVSILTYRYVEKPMIAVGRRISGQIHRPLQPAAS
ncbi:MULTISPECIES: acyltransferase family protein [Brucella]|uniref:acyltransferase family protein n=1 Tax=Brucella TaxID=234 RepID=UPI000A983928|nr:MULTISPECIES: acyltransferase [Brucella/Ochrobactrum group]MBA8843308.1 peptidoglycan/LPS O-acetylase OafA/YrhL [Ochrobactrum sp. RH1CCR137]MBA8855496.1 peptidoglycan/LPS O-acetylase OafA/YrhL [Ochrobactrum sp. RH1CCR134]MDL2204168.1 acyltransferase [Brucella intermedia]